MSVILVCRDSREPDVGQMDSSETYWQAVRRFAGSVGESEMPRRLVLRDNNWLDPLQGALMDALDRETSPGDWLLTTTPVALFSASHDLDEGIGLLADRSIHWHDLSLHATLTDPGARINIWQLVQSLANLDRQRAAWRIRNVKQSQRRQGRYLGGGRPFGYMIHDDGRLIEKPLEQRILGRIHQLRDRGWSLRAIAKEVSTPMTPVSFKTVQRILQRNV